jgi:drug/metabolite transporter (DMT)-like permease
MPSNFPPSAAFLRLSKPVQGAVWGVLGSFFFAGMVVVIRLLADELPPFEIVFFRNLFGFAFMVPWFLTVGLATFKNRNHRLYSWRAALGLASMLCWFTGVAYLPMAEATALSFTTPLFATIAAVIILNEFVRGHRWIATFVGFGGAMIVLRPGFADLNLFQLAVLASALLTGISVVLIKHLTRTEPANAIVTYLTLYILPFSLITAIPVWVNPPLHTWPLLVLLGAFATLGHQAMTRSFVCLDASAATALDFIRLPFVAVLAWLFFTEVPDIWTWAGAAVIVAATVYIARHEARAAPASTQGADLPVTPMAAAATTDPIPLPTTPPAKPSND